MKAIFLVVTILASLPFGLCSDDGSETDDPEGAALAAVKLVLGQDPGENVPVGESYVCTYRFDETTGLEPIVFSCRWDVEEQGDSFIVRFHEVWDCDDFAADYPDFPPCDDETGVHDWEYLVNPGGDVQLLEESGPYPPDYIR